MWSVKEILSAVALAVASGLAYFSLTIEPEGEIDQSVCITIAQFLVFAATLLGVDATFKRIKGLLKK